jgi:hypothetical protein
MSHTISKPAFSSRVDSVSRKLCGIRLVALQENPVTALVAFFEIIIPNFIGL